MRKTGLSSRVSWASRRDEGKRAPCSAVGTSEAAGTGEERGLMMMTMMRPLLSREERTHCTWLCRHHHATAPLAPQASPVVFMYCVMCQVVVRVLSHTHRQTQTKSARQQLPLRSRRRGELCPPPSGHRAPPPPLASHAQRSRHGGLVARRRLAGWGARSEAWVVCGAMVKADPLSLACETNSIP